MFVRNSHQAPGMARRLFVWSGVLGVLLAFGCLWLSAPAHALPDIEEYVVMCSATVQSTPPQVRLQWPAVSLATRVVIDRKLVTATSWTTTLVTVTGNEAKLFTSFIDDTVTLGTLYEYRVTITFRDLDIDGEYVDYQAVGYLASGVEVPMVEDRGTVILVIDTTFKTPLATELNRLEMDLIGDGWKVAKKYVSRTATAQSVRSLIQAEYNLPGANVKSVFCFGHVPVPLSGWLNPDGHSDHQYAWPADGYYGEMNGVWTDTQDHDNNVPTARRNDPGDGRFDQNTFPSDIELEVGRVDLYNMLAPTFSLTEKGLLKQYLDKDHNFRHRLIRPEARGIVTDNFGIYSDGFADNGWRNFSGFFGASNVFTRSFSLLRDNSYLWAYGCGGGSYITCGGVTSTDWIAANDPKVTFTMLFGSYFGDWDSPNNLMRAVLATRTYGLTCAWAGRPPWFFHHMGMGYPIGYSAKLTMNNNGLYRANGNSSRRGIHIALMGDPTLRQHAVAPPTNPTFTLDVDGTVELNWTDADEQVLGYYVYTATNEKGPYTRVTPELVTSNTYRDPILRTTTTYYMIRALRLETEASGSYYNLSQGAFLTVPIAYAVDMQYRASVDTKMSGNSVYYPTAQSRTMTTQRNPVTYYVRIDNDGTTYDTPTLTGTEEAPGWHVSYFDMMNNNEEVTDAVIGAGWECTNMPGHTYRNLKIVVTPDDATDAGSLMEIILDLRSARDGTKRDLVVLTTNLDYRALPDLQVRASTTDPYVGNGTYNLTGAEQIVQIPTTGSTAVFYLRVENDGNYPDAYRITGPASDTQWTITYWDAESGGTNITGSIPHSVTRDGWDTPTLLHGEFVMFRVEARPTAQAVGNTCKDISIRALSLSRSTTADIVIARALRGAQPQPDAQVCVVGDTLIGSGTLNTTGVDQTATHAVNTNQAARYEINIRNAGNIIFDRFRVTGPASVTGWTVRYFNDVSGGQNITSAVTGGGWLTETSDLWTTRSICVEVTPNSSIRAGVALPLLVTIASQADPSKRDVVGVTTSKTPLTVSVQVSPGSPLRQSDTLTLTATQVGGGTAKYSFRAFNGTTWFTLRGYSSTRTCSWTPPAVGTYTLVAWARENGSAATFDAQAQITGYRVEYQQITGIKLTSNLASPQQAGTAITFTATATGGTALQYRFGIYDGTTWTYTAYGSTSTLLWTPTVPGTYLIRAHVRSQLNPSQYKYTTVTYTVQPVVAGRLRSVTLSVLPAASQPVGTPITVRAVPLEATAHAEYRFRIRNGSTWRDLRAYATDPTVIWTPDAPGQYQLQVYARTVGSTKSYECSSAPATTYMIVAP